MNVHAEHLGEREHPRDEDHRYPHRLSNEALSRPALDELARRVGESLGFALGVIARAATDDDPGVVMFERMGTTEAVQVDERLVRSIIDRMAEEQETSRAAHATRKSGHTHDDPEAPADHTHDQVEGLDRWLTSAQTALDEAAAAETAEGKLDAVLGWFAREMAAVSAVRAMLVLGE